MANVDAPFGLRPVRYLSGAPYNGAANRYYIPATDTDGAAFVGDPVRLTGSGDADGVAAVTSNVSTTNAIVGVIVAVEPVTQESTLYREDSTERYVWVADDPNLVFEVQEDSVGGALTVDSIGATCQLTGFGTGSTSTGRSFVEVDSSAVSAVSDTDDDVRLIGIAQRPDNAVGVNSVWYVRLNNHQYINASVGV